MKYLSLKFPGYTITAPTGLPNGGIPENVILIRNILTILLIIGVFLALSFLIYGSILLIMSEGDKTKVQNGRNHILYAIIGLIVMFLSFTIINFVGYLFGGINLLKFN